MRILAIVVGAALLFQGDAEAALAQIIGEPVFSSLHDDLRCLHGGGV